MNLSELEERCLNIIDDAGYSATISTFINEAVLFIAGGVRMPDRSVSPPLPGLFTIGTVIAGPTDNKVALPAGFQRNLEYAYSGYSGTTVRVHRSFRRLVKTFPSMAVPGPVVAVAQKGSNLYYQGIPLAPDTLTIHYYRRPTDMTTTASTPDGIPEHLQERLITHRAAWRVFDEIEDGIEGRKVNTEYHLRRFYEAMDDLIAFVGQDGEPLFYEDTYGYDPEY